MKSILFVFPSLLLLQACQPVISPESQQPAVTPKPAQSVPPKEATLPAHRSLRQKLLLAEKQANIGGRKVLQTGRKMTLVDAEIILGLISSFRQVT